MLATHRQEPGEDLDNYLQALKSLSKDCIFTQVTAKQNRNDYIRDAFIHGLQSYLIRQRLLENTTLTLQTAFDISRALESAQKQSSAYHSPAFPVAAAAENTASTNQTVNTSLVMEQPNVDENQCTGNQIAAAFSKTPCFFCGYS